MRSARAQGRLATWEVKYRGDPLALVHAGDEASAEAMAARLGALIEIGETPPPEAPVLIERIG